MYFDVLYTLKNGSQYYTLAEAGSEEEAVREVKKAYERQKKIFLRLCGKYKADQWEELSEITAIPKEERSERHDKMLSMVSGFQAYKDYNRMYLAGQLG